MLNVFSTWQSFRALISERWQVSLRLWLTLYHIKLYFIRSCNERHCKKMWFLNLLKNCKFIFCSRTKTIKKLNCVCYGQVTVSSLRLEILMTKLDWKLAYMNEWLYFTTKSTLAWNKFMLLFSRPWDLNKSMVIIKYLRISLKLLWDKVISNTRHKLWKSSEFSCSNW